MAQATVRQSEHKHVDGRRGHGGGRWTQRRERPVANAGHDASNGRPSFEHSVHESWAGGDLGVSTQAPGSFLNTGRGATRQQVGGVVHRRRSTVGVRLPRAIPIVARRCAIFLENSKR